MNKYRFFSPSLAEDANALYEQVRDLPLICPHGHVNPRLFAEIDYRFGSPVDLLIIPDHYIFRMLYSAGIPLEQLGIPAKDDTPIEQDHRKIWQTVADHWYLMRTTPTDIWIRDELESVFGITDKLNSKNAQSIYDAIDEKLKSPDFTPRKLYEQFNIEVLTTTDSASDNLQYHQTIRDSGWKGRILPTFRPDAVVNCDREDWKANIDALSAVSGIDITDYKSYIQALEKQRAFFKSMGATATDHAALTAYTEKLSDTIADEIFQWALKGQATADDARRFTGHMLIEMARMSTEDGLVMQCHVGSFRNHNPAIFKQFGYDMGADIPLTSEFTRNLKPLLDAFGNHPNLRMILFNLDETTYSRELAPLAGHYPTLRLGPPWWFFDSINGIEYFFDRVMETCGIYNTAGFNDDTRAFASIPARHDVWRRVSANWLAGLKSRGIIDQEDAEELIQAMAYGLAKSAYKLD